MICKKCGLEIQDDVKFCPACGEELTGEEVTEVIAEETAEEVPEEKVEEITEEETSEEDFAEEEEYSKEIYDEEGNFIGYESITEEPEETKKSHIAAIIAVIVVIAIAAAGFAGYKKFIARDSGNDNPFIYTKADGESANIYYNSGSGEKQIATLGENQTTFAATTTFVVGGKNVFYTNDGNLYYINGKLSEPALIDEKVSAGTTVVSADDKTILYIKKDESDNNVLYTYTIGGKTSAVETLGLIKADNSYPLYGFADETSNIWYIKKNTEDETQMGEMFVKKGKSAVSVATDVYRGFYCSADGKTAVYLTIKDEKENLMYKENGGEPVVVSENYSEQFPPVFVKKPSKGFMHLGDVAESETGVTGTLYYRPFGKAAVAVDTDVTAYSVVTEENTYFSNPYFDYSVQFAENSNILYQRSDQTVLFSKNGTYGTMPEGCTYYESNPTFSKDSDSVVFTDANDSAVKYSKYGKDGWSTPVKIADKADYTMLNRDGSMAALLSIPETTEEEGAQMSYNYILSVYDVKTQQTSEVTTTAAGLQFFGGADNKTLYYAEDINMAAYTMQLSQFAGGTDSVIDSAVSEFTVSGSGRPIVLKASADAQMRAIDLYIFENGALKLIGSSITGLNLY